MLKKIVALFFISIIVAVLVLGSLAFWFNTAPNKDTDASIAFTIKSGESVSSIAKRLESTGIIRSALYMQLLSRVYETQDLYQAGSYLIPVQSSVYEIQEILTTGKQIQIKVTLPEGYTARQVAHVLEAAKIVDAESFLAVLKDKAFLVAQGLDFLDSAEGYLFPDTYLFQENSSAELVAAELIHNFLEKLKQIKNLPEDPREVYQGLILASIIEREYVDPAEAPLISSVFHNRLDLGKPLESCATVVYVMTEELGLEHPSRIFYRDLARPSAYNTYLHKGLPPGPIANPGLNALQASFNPEKSSYLYFVLRGPNAKQHYFSDTFAEHNQASVFYLKNQTR